MADGDHEKTIIITTPVVTTTPPRTTTEAQAVTTTVEEETTTQLPDTVTNEGVSSSSVVETTVTPVVANINGANKRIIRLFQDRGKIFQKKGQNAFCCVHTCKNSSKKNPNLHFHTFPKDGKTINGGERNGENMREVWRSQIRRMTFRITKDTLVCSQHFNSDDYKPRTKRNKLYGQPGHSHRLNDNAYPTLFCWNNFGKGKKSRFTPKEPAPDNTTSDCDYDDEIDTESDMIQEVEFDGDLSSAPTMSSEALDKECNPHSSISKALKASSKSPTSCNPHSILSKALKANSKSSTISNSYSAIRKALEASSSESHEKELPVIDMMHNYSLPSELDNAHGVIRDLRKQLDQTKVETLRFSLDRYGTDKSIIEHYTGFASYETLTKFFQTLEGWEHASIMRSKIRVNSQAIDDPVESEKGLQLIDQFVLYQMYVYRGLSEIDLAARFMVPVATVTNIIITWADILFFFLGVWAVWPTREQVKETMLPSIFQESKFVDTRVVIEYTELRIEETIAPLLRSHSYKDYKSSYAYKGVVGLAPNGTVTFASRLMAHSQTHTELILNSGILQKCEKGDAVMVDSDLIIGDACLERGIKMYHPPYQNGEPYTEASEVVTVELIDQLRTQVDPVIKRIHENVIFHHIPNSMKDTISQMWVVACLLCNFQKPIDN